MNQAEFLVANNYVVLLQTESIDSLAQKIFDRKYPKSNSDVDSPNLVS